MECGELGPAFRDGGSFGGGGGAEQSGGADPSAHSNFPKIIYSIKSIYIMIPALKLRLFLRILSLFAANRLKCLCMSILHEKLGLSNQG